MATPSETPQARPLYRKLALGTAIVCFLLGAAFAISPIEGKTLTTIACLIVGAVMLTIGNTGYWPPRRDR